MLDTHAPKSYWGRLTHCYLSHQWDAFSSSDFKTPLEVFVPTFLYFKRCLSESFWLRLLCHVHGPAQSKLDPRALKCVFVGYSPKQKGYKCYQPPSRKQYLNGCHFFWNTITFLFILDSSSVGELERRGFFWCHFMFLLPCLSRRNNLLMSPLLNLLISYLGHLRKSWEFTLDARKVKPSLWLHVKHPILTQVILLILLIWILQYLLSMIWVSPLIWDTPSHV
jgi:hypothetical protein